ncbi:MAG: rod shape-determining protein MreD, partial [Bacteroidota bacterium]|nr:rod shape-determining protein MreD [Bacteroidota bacterium]
MMKDFGKYTIIFVGLVLLQVLILNNIQFSGFINPYVYILFIMLLPFTIPGYAILGLSFLLGVS